MRLKDISINNLRRRKGKVFFLIVGLTMGITTVVTLLSVTRMMNEDNSKKLDEFGANILIIPRSDDLSLSYGGMNIGGVAIDSQSLKDSDIPKIRQIEVRENVSVVSPKLVGVIGIDGKKVPLMGVQFEEELRLKKWWKIHGKEPKNQDEVLLRNEAAVRLFKSTGDAFSINGKPVRISGVLDETGLQDDFLILGNLAFVQEALKRPGVLSLIEVSAFCNSCPIEEIVKQVSQKLPHAKVTAIKQTLQTKMEALDHFKKFSVGISVIVLLIGSLIVFTNMGFGERAKARDWNLQSNRISEIARGPDHLPGSPDRRLHCGNRWISARVRRFPGHRPHDYGNEGRSVGHRSLVGHRRHLSVFFDRHSFERLSRDPCVEDGPDYGITLTMRTQRV